MRMGWASSTVEAQKPAHKHRYFTQFTLASPMRVPMLASYASMGKPGRTSTQKRGLFVDLILISIGLGFLAVLYGIFTSRQVLNASAGNARMQEIAGAIQEGAQAYLNRQYTTIGIVGVVAAIIVGLALGRVPAVGFVIGAVLS